MRPKTSCSGIFRTKRSRPLNVSRLTSMLVPKPKNAFQSPRVQIAGFVSLIFPYLFTLGSPLDPRLCKRRQNSVRVRYPAEYPALRLDHFQAHLLKFRKIRSDTILRHETIVAAIIGLA